MTFEETIYYFYIIFGWLLVVYWLLGKILNYYKINNIYFISYDKLTTGWAILGGLLLNIIIFRRFSIKYNYF